MPKLRTTSRPPARTTAAALPDRERVGERLRAIRKRHGLTLGALSARSGVALSTLSKIELGQISVSYEKFAAVARALDVDIASLFDPLAEAAPAAGRRPVVVRTTLDAAPRYDAENYDYRMLATGFPAKRMTPLHGIVVARQMAQFPGYIRHPGQEFVMVLSGRVRIHFETGEVVDLARQESAYFDSGVGHVYLSTGKADARVVVVMTE
ncbi:helix-turn-helix domain-containing protein [Rhizobacter sp. OV335]|uniref:helix-turn-helix domain-containing protein n=1 Tax=Rhizobacter sp. OV335 TaxID=1500264 RepID=UPI000912191A|nr:XRE family transcriptional regulator [Rhizobacter sp. OV335]SHN08473.1 transcriptional regulator, XRE family with cupin sensor [Rhizobacter sp. OV335]